MKARLDLPVKPLPDEGSVRKQSRKVIATDGAVFVDVKFLQDERAGVAWKVPVPDLPNTHRAGGSVQLMTAIAGRGGYSITTRNNR